MSASLKQIDVHGMLPRTHIFATNHKDGNIVIIIPLHYLRGLSDRCSSNMKISMSYEIMNGNFCNRVGNPQFRVCGRDYDLNGDSVWEGEWIANEEVITNITSALNYFKYVKEHLNNNKDHPLSYETYIAYRIGT